MSDNRHRYRTIKCVIKELYPTEPKGNKARHLDTLAAMIRGIFYGPSENTARLFDVWSWHVWTSRATLPQTRVLVIILTVVLGGGFVTSTIWFASILRRSL